MKIITKDDVTKSNGEKVWGIAMSSDFGIYIPVSTVVNNNIKNVIDIRNCFDSYDLCLKECNELNKNHQHKPSFTVKIESNTDINSVWHDGSPIKKKEVDGINWISVEDYLPDNLGLLHNDLVLFWSIKHGMPRVGCYDYEMGEWYELPHTGCNETLKFDMVSHWMPLPERPII